MGKISRFFIASEGNDYRPPVLSYKAFLIYGILLLLLRIFLNATTAGGAAVESGTLMQLINEERSSRNLVILTTNQSLNTAAGQKAQDMIDRDYFAHVDPDGNYVWNKIIAAGYGAYKILGENLAVDFATSEGMVRAWIDSPTHRANLLHTDFRDQGLSALYGDYEGRYTNLTASLFGVKPAAQTTPPPPASTPESDSGRTAPTPKPAPAPVPAPTPKPTPPPAPSPAKIPERNLGGQEPAPSNTVIKADVQTSTEPSASNGLVGFASPIQAGKDLVQNISKSFTVSRMIFTLFGLFLFLILSVDSVIIFRHEYAVGGRSHSSYHLFSMMLVVLISILIWWW